MTIKATLNPITHSLGVSNRLTLAFHQGCSHCGHEQLQASIWQDIPTSVGTLEQDKRAVLVCLRDLVRRIELSLEDKDNGD